MADIHHYLETIQPELDHVVRLFGIQGEAFFTVLQRTAEERDGLFRISFSDGEREVSRTASAPTDSDVRLLELHRKRTARRLCKQTL